MISSKIKERKRVEDDYSLVNRINRKLNKLFKIKKLKKPL